MNAPQLLEKTDSYVGAQWREPAPHRLQAFPPFVTISRESGSGGTALARLLVRDLNATTPPEVCWTVAEGMITTRMLRDNRLPENLGRFLPEDRIAELGAAVGELVGLHPSLWELVQKTNTTIRRLARGGHVVIVGRGACFVTADLPGGVHVRLVAPADYRARRLAELYGLSESEALALNAKRDAAARRYVRSTFEADVAAPEAYDLVINTAHVPLEQAAALVLAQVRSRAAARPVVTPAH